MANLIRTALIPLIPLLALASCGGAPDDGLYGRGAAASGGKPIWPSAPSGGAGGSASGGAPDQPSAGGQGATAGSGSASQAGGAAGTAGDSGGGSSGAPSAGQCAGRCGGAALDESCFCDVSCKQYGDCCADFASSCPEQASAPLGQGCTPAHCNTEQESSEPNGICFCDAACSDYGDCCSNKLIVCGP
jgi:hypothetical protein